MEGVAARPSDCALEFLEKRPGRPYDELGELETHVTAPPPGGAREALHADACRLGADAVIVTRDFVTNEFGHAMVAGTAIKYRSEAPDEPAPAPPAAEPQGSTDSVGRGLVPPPPMKNGRPLSGAAVGGARAPSPSPSPPQGEREWLHVEVERELHRVRPARTGVTSLSIL